MTDLTQPNIMAAETVKSYAIGGRSIELETGPEVFSPTSTSQQIAKVLDIPQGASVLDMGCGVGILAIYAALEGAGRVVATDIMPEACRLARLNAARNAVAAQVTVLSGNLFDPIPPQKFDIIVDDVSGIADEVARLSGWFPEPVPTGGDDGADHVVGMLEQVKDFLSERGSLYLPVASLSNMGRILGAARRVFGDKIEQLSEVQFPFGPELKEHLERLAVLRSQGLIDFQERKSRQFWSLHIYRAWL